MGKILQNPQPIWKCFIIPPCPEHRSCQNINQGIEAYTNTHTQTELLKGFGALLMGREWICSSAHDGFGKGYCAKNPQKLVPFRSQKKTTTPMYKITNRYSTRTVKKQQDKFLKHGSQDLPNHSHFCFLPLCHFLCFSCPIVRFQPSSQSNFPTNRRVTEFGNDQNPSQENQQAIYENNSGSFFLIYEKSWITLPLLSALFFSEKFSFVCRVQMVIW